MKKSITLSLLIIICSLVIESCNNPKSNDDKQAASTTNSSNNKQTLLFDDSCTVANYLIKKTEAEQMLRTFERVFKKKGNPDEYKKLGMYAWIDAAVVNAFSDFLSTNDSLNGIRFFPGAFSDSSTCIMMVPTKAINAKEKNDLWDTDIQVSGNYAYKDFNLKHTNGWPRVERFGELYRKERIRGQLSTAFCDSLQRSVWFDKCAIKLLSDQLKDTSKGLDGISIYFASYNKKTVGNSRGQFKDIQGTFIIFLTKSDNSGGHVELRTYFEDNYSNSILGGLNHGQICHNECN
jgi:hypothetical protein